MQSGGRTEPHRAAMRCDVRVAPSCIATDRTIDRTSARAHERTIARPSDRAAFQTFASA
ncbi:hypothetical protein BURPS1655_C0469 [Burkholderia pseudomallei 1655]|nr:hypothetical protein BURPS1655_C0469 [Burkholderia pseudomallei 1655]